MRIRIQSLQIAILIGFLVLMGMTSTLVPYLASPNDRVFAGFHGYSADYVQYVSYIKAGMYGRYHMYFRSFPPTQPATPIHWEYTLFGIIGRLFGLNAPATYHLVRVVLGCLLVYSAYRLFLLLFLKHNLALISTLVAFTASYVHTHYFPFFVSTPQRAADRPHYLLGSVVFLLIMHFIMRHKISAVASFLLFLMSFAVVMVHVSSGIVLTALGIVMISLSLTLPDTTNHKRQHVWQGVSIVLGCLTAALVTNHYVQIYSQISDIFVDKFTYARALSLPGVIQQSISFGPILWLGLPGLLLHALYNRDISKHVRWLMLAWGITHMALFFVLYPLFHVDQVRFVQSLYFIPLTYGTMCMMTMLSKRFGKIILPISVSILLLITLPTYVAHVHRDLGDMTDYQTFSPFGFPTKRQYQAYQFLDLQSPLESTVLAQYEAANLLLMYSHNRVIGNDQGWSPRDAQAMMAQTSAWFSGSLSPVEAREFLDKYNVSYIYYGYQERNFGDITHYLFLEIVYNNPEVTIYKVTPQ